MLNLTTEQTAALRKRIVQMNWFLSLSLPAGFTRVWDGLGNIVVGGNTWYGIRECGRISGVGDTSGLEAGVAYAALLGIPRDAIPGGIIAETRGVRYSGRPVAVSIGIINPDTGAAIGSLVPVWSGVAGSLDMQIGETVSVTLPIERADFILRRSNGLRANSASHAARTGSPTDSFFNQQNRALNSIVTTNL